MLSCVASSACLENVQELDKDEYKVELAKGSLNRFHELILELDAAERIDAEGSQFLIGDVNISAGTP